MYKLMLRYKRKGKDPLQRCANWAVMEKAVRWAVQSAASASEPTVTVLVLPDWSVESNTAYRKWMTAAPDFCHELANITSRCFKFRDIDAWRGLPAHHEHQRWGVTVLLVANMEGFKDLEEKLDYENFHHDLQVALKVVKDPKCTWAGTFTHINAHMDKIATVADQAPDLHIPDKFKRMRTDDTAAVGLLRGRHHRDFEQ
jgi:hypothetical protein